jgi:hypothetical protein
VHQRILYVSQVLGTGLRSWVIQYWLLLLLGPVHLRMGKGLSITCHSCGPTASGPLGFLLRNRSNLVLGGSWSKPKMAEWRFLSKSLRCKILIKLILYQWTTSCGGFLDAAYVWVIVWDNERIIEVVRILSYHIIQFEERISPGWRYKLSVVLRLLVAIIWYLLGQR